jgi:CubicO group peptidase (beta-lactamase class C family)
MRKSVMSWGIFCFVFLLVSCDDGEVEVNDAAEFETYLTEEMESQNIPALSTLIFRDETVLFEKQLGKSNIAQDVALAANHPFLLASISKVITATALLQLYEDGLLGLDDKVNDYLPFNVSIPNYTTDVTFRMLLTHTSGIADGSALDGLYYYGVDSPVALGDFLENYLSPSGNLYNATENFHDFEPGSKHEYSNTGNALIGLLVEQISGIGFNEYCKQNIFTPLEMTNTAWRLDEITQTIVQPYNYVSNQYEAIDHYTFTDYPNGGLRSTAGDLFKFLSALAQEGTFNSTEILKASTVTEMITPQIPSIDNEMGLHLFLMNADNNLWGHDGGEKGAATIMAFNPATNIGAIILANQGEANLDDVLVNAYKFGLKL